MIESCEEKFLTITLGRFKEIFSQYDTTVSHQLKISEKAVEEIKVFLNEFVVEVEKQYGFNFLKVVNIPAYFHDIEITGEALTKLKALVERMDQDDPYGYIQKNFLLYLV